MRQVGVTCACGAAKAHTATRCRACDLERRRELRKQDPENVRNRAYKRSRYVDPAKRRARNKAGNAVRRGTMQKLPCEVCGAPKAEMHHEDYDRPLEVRWLCRTHHLELHRKAA